MILDMYQLKVQFDFGERKVNRRVKLKDLRWLNWNPHSLHSVFAWIDCFSILYCSSGFLSSSLHGSSVVPDIRGCQCVKNARDGGLRLGIPGCWVSGADSLDQLTVDKSTQRTCAYQRNPTFRHKGGGEWANRGNTPSKWKSKLLSDTVCHETLTSWCSSCLQ